MLQVASCMVVKCRLYTVDEMGAANAVTDDTRVWESVVGL